MNNDRNQYIEDKWQNYILKDKVDGLDLKIREKYKKADGWLPFETYDMIQCGYPYPDHGEMVLRVDSGINENNELLPATGMWCKVKDVIELIKKYDPNAFCKNTSYFEK